MMTASPSAGGPLVSLTRALLFALIFSLALPRPALLLGGLAAAPTDLIFLLLFAAWVAALIQRQCRLRWHPFFWAMAAYFAAMALSVAASPDPARSAFKLATQVYLLALPVILYSLVEDMDQLRRAVCWWLRGAMLVALLSFVTAILFYLYPVRPVLSFSLSAYGTLVPGPYPRVRATFENINMLCNYLSVALMLLVVAQTLGWIALRTFILLLAAFLVSALLTISPGLGGIALTLGLWIWLAKPGTLFGRTALAGACAAALLFVLASSVTPVLHPTAPYLIEVPFTGTLLAPSGRLMLWTDALRTFIAHPWLGRGVGMDAAHVLLQVPSSEIQTLTDAHNGFLNIAAQCGLVGLCAFLLLIGWLVRDTVPLRLERDQRNAARLGFGLALLGALGYQGLAGSFEDARHIWVLVGLFLAAGRIERAGGSA